MDAGNSLTRNLNIRLWGGILSRAIGSYGLGLFLGIIAVTMWQQWSLTFGQDPEFLLAICGVLSLTFWLGQRWQNGKNDKTSARYSLAPLVTCLAVWSLLHPFWIDALTDLIAYVPITWLEDPLKKIGIAVALACLGWFVPGILWTAIVAQAEQNDHSSNVPKRNALLLVLSGVASGLLLNSLVLAPWLGLSFPATVAAVTTSLATWCLRRRPFDRDQFPLDIAAGRATGTYGMTAVRLGMAAIVGCQLACNLRLVNQLMPHGAFVLTVEIAGAICGIVLGSLVTVRRSDSEICASWGGLIAAAASSFLLALQPWLVDLSLLMNASLTTVSLLLLARVALLMAVAGPFGFALGWIASSKVGNARPGLVGFASSFAAGLGAATFVLSGVYGLFPVMAGCCGLLVLASALLRVRGSGWSVSLRTASVLGCLIAMALSLPLWRSCDNPSRTAKLLFSTPTFIAYRSGWDLEHLPFLDDVRMIDRREGRTGPLTLWRGRVAELYVREAGIPRAVVTRASDVVPQFPPEVLQAVYSLVIADRPSRVLVLGLSAGTPLTTCLGFPIREAVCCEGDANLIDLVSGPLARETGVNPLTDDRVTLRRVCPELALMAPDPDRFDVILSCPSSSSMTEGATSFTQEFYQRSSRQLAERGLFCQRFECVDYGPEPLRMVLKAMRAAFQQVIAIETSSGELLLFAANTENVFVPSELATRLETPHVRRILARSGLDWSTLLNQPTYDHAALGEICDESRTTANSAVNGQLAAWAPLEVMRWGNKLHEVQTVLTSTRLSPAPFWTEKAHGQPNWLNGEIQLTRRSRLVEWLGDAGVTKELLRRLEEIVSQQTLVRENAEDIWWKYRTTLRKQLQDRPRAAVQQVKAIDQRQTRHPEDIRRRDYFVALGNAVTKEKPTRKQIAAVEEFVEPYDPLLSYFARRETAELLARSGDDAARELVHRLHVIYFAPALDASVRNVARSLVALVDHPDAIPDDSTRFDALNSLIQTLRVRWEVRQSIPENSSQKILNDLDRSLIAVEKGVASLDGIHASAGVPDQDWQTRKQVIERLMLRPLRAYRVEIQSRQQRGQAQAKAIFDEATKFDDESQPDDEAE